MALAASADHTPSLGAFSTGPAGARDPDTAQDIPVLPLKLLCVPAALPKYLQGSGNSS